MLNVFPQDGLIRKVRVGEIAKFCEHLLRLDADSRRSRFAATVSDEFVRNYANISIWLDTVVHAFYVDGVMRAAAELRLLSLVRPRQAEATFSVEKTWQSRGIGTALMHHALFAARDRGFDSLHAACLVSNGPMLGLLRKFDAQLRFDSGSFVGEAEPSGVPMQSLFRGITGDGQGFVMAMLDLQA